MVVDRMMRIKYMSTTCLY